MPKKVVLADFCDELVEESGCYSVVLFPIVSKDVQALFGVSFDMDVCGAVIEDVFEGVAILFEAIDEGIIAMGNGIGNPAFYVFFIISVFTIPRCEDSGNKYCWHIAWFIVFSFSTYFISQVYYLFYQVLFFGCEILPIRVTACVCLSEKECEEEEY